MAPPWKGPRYQSWASNTVISGAALVVILISTIIIDALNGSEPPPTYLTGLLGVAAGAFFGAVGVDKGKKEADIEKTAVAAASQAAESSETALRAELKADILAEIAAQAHPETQGMMPPPLIPRRQLTDEEIEVSDQIHEEDDAGGSSP
jgi:hypothetical protein